METALLDLTDRIAIVTGAGQGIGREIALTLARAGAHIVIAEQNAAAGEDTAQLVRELGRRALAITTNVVSLISVEAMVAAVMSEFGQIDILVNNAAIALNVPSEDATEEEWNRIIGVNLYGVLWCCTAVGRHMLKRQQGAIVNIGSISGTIVNKPQPQAGYNLSKAAVIHLTKSLAAEWADRNVRVNCVSPGYISTELLNKGLKEKPEWGEIWYDMTPQRRLGKPADIANVVLYLVSDVSNYATGSDWIIDGGYTLW